MENGFTLIELLVVIGIIGILSSAALLRYPVTIEKVRDARIASEMSQFREQASVLTSLTGKFAEVDGCALGPPCVCATDASLNVLCSDIQKNTDEATVLNVNENQEGFCFVAHLPGENTYFCVDGKLRAKQYVDSPLTCVVGCGAGNNCSCE